MAIGIERRELGAETQARVRAAGGVSLVSLLTFFALGVHGYHPFVEDGAVYGAGIRKLLDPGLYPVLTEFVTEHLRFSLYARLVAGLTRAAHVRLEWMLLALYLASVWLTLWAGWMLMVRVAGSFRARAGGVCLLACWLTLPVAGTSLMLVDPYLTARSFSTPLVMLAMAWALDARGGSGWGKGLLCVAALAGAACVHPLMAGYGVLAVVLLVLAGGRRRWFVWGVLAVALGVAAVVEWRAPVESAEYVRVALTRYYWFPLRWRAYELFGLAAPLVLLAWPLRGQEAGAWRALARSAVWLGGIGLAVALGFAHEGFRTHAVARLQPLRCFQVVYVVMILLLGGWLGERVLGCRAWRWAALLGVLGGVSWGVQHETFPHSGHIEWPGSAPENAWAQAFVWVRGATPRDALFALDAHYVMDGRGADAQGFRAIAERSALPDYSKDGGEAAITPGLTADWVMGQRAQDGLETLPDAERVRRLRPLGVTWVVLEARSVTGWVCPYDNGAVKVCRLP